MHILNYFHCLHNSVNKYLALLTPEYYNMTQLSQFFDCINLFEILS